ncbi:MAG: HNH endonuclease [Firmicutes bacterium]|nr:HNH endonuclease [Bacillota bacterium]
MATFFDYPKVFVVDKNGKPLLPTHPARARMLLKKGGASVERVLPFTIRLNSAVENPVGTLKAKAVDGSKKVGIALVNEFTGEVVFRGVIVMRQNVSRLITLRREYRRNRRYRKVRHRKARFSNRKQLMPPPSIRQKKEAILRVLRDLAKIAPISDVDLALPSFDISSIAAGRKLYGDEYARSPYAGTTVREKVLNRDGRKCVLCGSETKLERHHVVFRSRGGTDTPQNQVTLCKKCQREIHVEGKRRAFKSRMFQDIAHAQAGKVYLISLLKEFGEVSVCSSKEIKGWREKVGLEKSHANDVSVLFTEKPLKFFGPEYAVFPLRRRKEKNNVTKKFSEKNGLRHFDVVRAERVGKKVYGSIRSFKSRPVLVIRTPGSDNYEVSLSKTNFVYRPRNLVYLPVC